MIVQLDPIPYSTLEDLHLHMPRVAARIEDCLDWLEADPVDPRARRRQFTNGMRAISPIIDGDEWLILWEEDPPNTAVVRFIGQSDSI